MIGTLWRTQRAACRERSEERRVGEEGRSRGGPDYLKKKKNNEMSYGVPHKRDNVTSDIITTTWKSSFRGSREDVELTAWRYTAMTAGGRATELRYSDTT